MLEEREIRALSSHHNRELENQLCVALIAASSEGNALLAYCIYQGLLVLLEEQAVVPAQSGACSRRISATSSGEHWARI